MRLRWIALGAIGLLPMAAAPLLTRSMSEHFARRVAELAGKLAATIQSAPGERSEVSPGLPPSSPNDELPSELLPDDLRGSQPANRQARRDRKGHGPRRGIMVRREVVRAAAKAGVRPSGAPVPATDDHPAGLQVYGVGGTGALRDGDVITKVGGMAPRSTEDVIAVVAGAYRNKVYVISGEFWRNGEPWNAVVELPEPKGPAAR